MKKILSLFLVCLLSASLALAVDVSAKSGTSSFWGKLRKMIEAVTPKKKLAVTTAVGGVRGAKNDAETSLYWKDEAKEILVSEDELVAFTNAVQTASEGNKEQALVLFDSFMTDYPESSFLEEAKQAMAFLEGEEPQPAEQ